MAKMPAPPRPRPSTSPGTKLNKSGSKHAARIPEIAHHRSWSDCGGWAGALVREGSTSAGRIENCIPTNSLCKFHDAGQRLYRVERNAHRGLLRGFNTAQHALVYLPCISDNRSRVSFSYGFSFTQNGNTRRSSRLSSEHERRDRTENNALSRHQVSDRYKNEYRHPCEIKTVYGYGFSTSGHIHTVRSNIGRDASLTFYLGILTCPGGLGGGTGLVGAGALATKVSFLGSVNKTRMEKKGELGNQLSRMGGVA